MSPFDCGDAAEQERPAVGRCPRHRARRRPYRAGACLAPRPCGRRGRSRGAREPGGRATILARHGIPPSAPAAAALARRALAAKWRALINGRQSWRLLRSATGAGGGLHPPRAAACSLVQKTGSRRRLAVVSVNIAEVRAASHALGATVNDAVLVAVAGALRRVLAANGESLDIIVVTVPVSGRNPAGQGDLGNMVSPLLVPVAAAGSASERMEQVAARIRAGKAAAVGPAPIAVLGWLFRPLARCGGYRWYMNHQHRFHTLVSHVRGPAERLNFGGSPITEAIPHRRRRRRKPHCVLRGALLRRHPRHHGDHRPRAFPEHRRPYECPECRARIDHAAGPVQDLSLYSSSRHCHLMGVTKDR